MAERRCDILVAGGGLGGVAAALAATARGRSVVLSEPTDWLGGQLTSQAVPPDEHRWIERCGCTRSYRRLRDGIRAHYRAHMPLTERARLLPELNPGACTVSRLAHEPRIALAVLHALLAPALADGRLTVLLRHRPVAAGVTGDRVDAVTLAGPGGEVVVAADHFLDATETGALLPACGAEHVTGSESRDVTGEPHAGPVARPDNLQPVSVCFALDHLVGEDHTIAPPPRRPAGVLVDRARPADEPARAAPAGPEPGRGPVRDRPRLRRPGARQGPVAVPPDRGARPVRAGRVPERHHARELAADRLHGRSGARRLRRGRPRAQPPLPALDATGAPRAAAARRRRRRHARRAREGAVRARGAADRGAAHGGRAGHRARRARRARRRGGPRRRGDRPLPDRPAPVDRRGPLPRHPLLPVPAAALRADPAAAREPDRGRQVPRHHAHHQRRVPPAPGRVERRRGGRPPRRVLRRGRRPAARGRRAAGAARPLPGRAGRRPGSSARGRMRSGAGIPDRRRASSPECASSSPPAGVPATSGR